MALQALKFTTLRSFGPEKTNSPPQVIPSCSSSSSYVFALCGSNFPAWTCKTLNKSSSCSRLRQGCFRSLGGESGSNWELSSHIELAENVDGSNFVEASDVSGNSKMDFLEPSLFGIWSQRDEIVRIDIEMRANSVQIPLSLRMIKRKHQQQLQRQQIGLVEGEELRNCPIKKAFSSMVFIVREIQSTALHIRERLCSEDLGDIVRKMERDMNGSFVWLFRQVFSQTPELMVVVMVFLAKLCVCSMVENLVSSPIQVQRLSGQILDEKSTIPLPGKQELDAEETALWKYVLDEVERMKFNDPEAEAIKRFVAPVNVEIEKDDYEEYSRTDLLYQINLASDPYNPLLLSNYAQFLYLIQRDYSRAYECFKRAINAVPPDAEALSRYADFLWIVRKDAWGAEEGYQQAIAAEPENPYYASKYVNFLWNNGGDETCYLHDASGDDSTQTSLGKLDDTV